MLDLLATTSDGFDVASATRAYLDTLQGPARAQSDAYFEGGYWLPLWGTAIGVLVDWLFLRFRIAHTLRAFGERVSKRAWIVTAITAFFYTLIGTLVTLPWTIYTGYTREKRYDLLDQTFGAWAGEQAIGIAMALVLMPLAVVAIYALIRRAPRSWWLWSTGVIGLFMLFAMVLGPVFIAPLFNE